MAVTALQTPKATDNGPDTGLAVLHLGKTFKTRPVLRDVSLSVQRGEAVVLLGPHTQEGQEALAVVGGERVEQGQRVAVHLRSKSARQVGEGPRNNGHTPYRGRQNRRTAVCVRVCVCERRVEVVDEVPEQPRHAPVCVRESERERKCV